MSNRTVSIRERQKFIMMKENQLRQKSTSLSRIIV